MANPAAGALEDPRPPKLIHVVYALTPGAFAGGVSKMVYELATAQRQQDVDVIVWTVAAEADEIASNGLRIRSFPGSWRLGVASSPALTAELRKLALARGPALIVHGHNTFHPLNRQVREAVRGTGARLFYSPHGALDPAMMRGYSLKALKKRAYVAFAERPHLRAASGLFALTPKERGQLKNLDVGVPIHVIPNGIAAVSLPAEDRPLRGGTSLGFIGRINPKKGLQHLIHALHLLRRSYGEATLTIAGNRKQFPAYVSELDRLAEKLGVVDALHWPGFLDEAAKQNLLAEIDVFLHASDSEGMPMAVLEAMEAGVPAIVTPGCCMQRAAKKGAVLEIAQSPIAFAETIARLADAPGERRDLGVRGQRHAWSVHSWPRIAELYTAIYSA